MTFEAFKGDITKLEVDAIVNAANWTLMGGGGVDGAIHHRAGRGLMKECKTLHGCRPGEAKITKGYKLPAKWVIHTVGPIWEGGTKGEKQILQNCYLNSLKIAEEHGIRTIAFPAISTGAYGYPREEAFRIAYDTVMGIPNASSFDEILFVFFSDSDLELFLKTARPT
jgi:O-acetyl-ADP-ribose deacetylase (regulator of RNase III)